MTPLVAVALTLATYLVGVAIQRRTRSHLLNPVLIAIVLIGITLRITRVPYPTYFASAQLIHFLLGPATVALAIPLVRAMQQIRATLWPMLLALLAGSLTAAISGYVLTRLCGGSVSLALSMLAKSTTTPIAMDVARTIGGDPSLTAVLAILSGILVAVLLHPIFHRLRIDDPAATGLAAGTAGSGIGAARVLDLHPLAAAFAAVAIGLNGLLTAALAPTLAHLLSRWK